MCMDRVLNGKFWLKYTKCVNAVTQTFVSNLMDVKGYQTHKNELRSKTEGKLYPSIYP